MNESTDAAAMWSLLQNLRRDMIETYSSDTYLFSAETNAQAEAHLRHAFAQIMRCMRARERRRLTWRERLTGQQRVGA